MGIIPTALYPRRMSETMEGNGLFTGIVEERGTLTKGAGSSMGGNGSGAEIFVTCSEVLNDTKIGDSICVNGVCLTVTTMTKSGFAAHAAQETLQRSTLGSIPAGSGVNLERALTLQTRIGGHLVAGHVDTTAQLIRKTTVGQSQTLRFDLDGGNSGNSNGNNSGAEFAKYIVEKGSIAIDGISLTVTMVHGSVFEVVVIPHTQANTTLENIPTGRNVNIETDIIARYGEKILLTHLNANPDANTGKDINTLLGLL